MSEKIVYVVATPIGNIEDISQRARRILESVDIIAAEDTRHTLKLLHLAKISPKKLVSYHDHNEEFRSEELVERILKEDLSVALVSDAGTPCISDPGYRIVALARQRGIKVTPIAGPSAAVALASVAGLPVNRFLFIGFLPTRESQREKEIKGWQESLGSVIFYDSPRRLLSTLVIIHRIWPNSILAVGRELTKFHEEVFQGSISEVLAWAQGKPEILDAGFYFEYGAACEQSGQPRRSEAALRRALQLNPAHHQSLNYLGYMWAERGRNLPEALQMIEKALSLSPGNPAYLDSQAWALFRLGNPSAARPLLEEALRQVPDDPTLLEHFGDIASRLGQTNQAKEAYEKAILRGGPTVPLQDKIKIQRVNP